MTFLRRFLTLIRRWLEVIMRSRFAFGGWQISFVWQGRRLRDVMQTCSMIWSDFALNILTVFLSGNLCSFSDTTRQVNEDFHATDVVFTKINQSKSTKFYPTNQQQGWLICLANFFKFLLFLSGNIFWGNTTGLWRFSMIFLFLSKQPIRE